MDQAPDRSGAGGRKRFFRELTDAASDYIRHVVKWHSPGSEDGLRHDGETLAEMYQRFGKGDEVPDEPEVPDCASHVLAWFFDLNRRRAPGFSGVSPLQFGDIEAWQRLTGTDATPAEIRMILAIDDAYRDEAARVHKPKKEPSEEPPPKGFFGK